MPGNRRLGNDIIAGTFYIVGSNKNGDLVSLTEDKIKFYTEMFYEPEMLKILGTEKDIEKVTIEDDVVKENVRAYLHILDDMYEAGAPSFSEYTKFMEACSILLYSKN